jgi:hypothetical protein
MSLNKENQWFSLILYRNNGEYSKYLPFAILRMQHVQAPLSYLIDGENPKGHPYM